MQSYIRQRNALTFSKHITPAQFGVFHRGFVSQSCRASAVFRFYSNLVLTSKNIFLTTGDTKAIVWPFMDSGKPVVGFFCENQSLAAFSLTNRSTGGKAFLISFNTEVRGQTELKLYNKSRLFFDWEISFLPLEAHM